MTSSEWQNHPADVNLHLTADMYVVAFSSLERYRLTRATQRQQTVRDLGESREAGAIGNTWCFVGWLDIRYRYCAISRIYQERPEKYPSYYWLQSMENGLLDSECVLYY